MKHTTIRRQLPLNFWAALLALFLPLFLFSQNNQAPAAAGASWLRNYTPEAYRAHNQNWAIAQDGRGVMYFGNGKGILEYDGASWNLIPVNERRIARSLSAGADGQIFVGGYGDIGHLLPDSTHRLQFVSLLPNVEERYRDFADVWCTLATPDGTFFITARYVFRWNGQEMRVWPAQTAFQSGFWVNDRFYVQQKDLGLMHIVSDSLQPAPQGKQWTNESISAMLPFDNKGKKNILIATRNKGLFLYHDFSISRFPTDVDDLLINMQIYRGITLTNGQFAFGLMQGGVIIVDAAGKLRQHIHKPTGLQDEAVLSLYEDRQGALWIGMQIGIARAETGSPLSYFGAQDGIEGSIWDVLRHEGRLYFASIMGLFYLDESPGALRNAKRFKRAPGVSPQCWSLLSFGKTLLASTFDGVYEIRGDQSRRITDGYVFALHRSQQDPNRVFAGMRSGVKSLYFEGGQWREEGHIENLDEEIRHFYETPDGKLWLITYFNGLLLADFSKGYTRKPAITRYNTQQGLPPADRVIAFPTDKGLRFATLQGVFAFDEPRQQFYRDSTLIQGLPDNRIGLFFATQDPEGNLWLVADDNAHSGVALRQSRGRYVWDQSPFLRIAELPVFMAYPDPIRQKVVWIGGTDQVVRYDGAVPQNIATSYPTLIRQIVANGDSLLYGGAESGLESFLKLPFTYNSLRFRYAAPSFDDESKTEFQYMLKGFDADWSNWSTESYKDYTGLPPGEYRFMVRAKNIYRHISETAVFEFRVLPPFYRSWWAYLLYALLLAGVVFQVWRYALKRIHKQHLRALKELEYEKLKELDQLKSRFFADISHEFRTPLTLILGPLDNLLSAAPPQEQARQFGVIKRNAQRLLRLINQLLDLSKLEAGKMELEFRRQDIIPLLKGLSSSFESLVQTRKIDLHFESTLESALLDFDLDKIEQVFTNILSNAIKFTPEGGAVTVSVRQADAGNKLQIDVADNGAGIPETQLPHVFDRFYQGAGAFRTHEPGTGIGLALTKELVELHQGSISVSSREGQGAQFTVLLPFSHEGTAAEPADEIAARPTPVEVELLEIAAAFKESDSPFETTLLLVEDNPDMRSFIREILSAHFQVIEATDGREGVEKALEYIPDLIVSDVMMPEMDGLGLCEALKNDERTSHIPIILLTAKADIESRIAGLERGADDYLSKPFNREELLARTRNLLNLRRRLRERYASLQPTEPAQDKDTQVEDAFLQKIRSIVEEHLSDSAFEIDQLARVVGMSRSQLFRKIKALTGQSPSLHIRAIRLHRGKELLETTEMNVTEVAYEVGFSTPAYFSDAFAEKYGVRPSQVGR
ncbi:MAG: response regulator [Saprospiraceae bacterium]|nr:response regulator [Saprospiraceae bacterium]